MSILVAAFVIITLGIILVVVINTDTKSIISQEVSVSSSEDQTKAPQYLFQDESRDQHL